MGRTASASRQSTAPTHGRGNPYPRCGGVREEGGMSSVLVIDQARRSLAGTVLPHRETGRPVAAVPLHDCPAIVLRLSCDCPAIVLKEGAAPEEPMAVRLKIDPGSQTTGLAALNEVNATAQ